jgi:hypothetical protein
MHANYIAATRGVSPSIYTYDEYRKTFLGLVVNNLLVAKIVQFSGPWTNTVVAAQPSERFSPPKDGSVLSF